MRRQGLIRVGAVWVESYILWFAKEELRLYRARKRRLASLESDHAWSTPGMEAGVPRGSTPGNPTASRAMGMMDDPEIQTLRSSVDLIDRILKTLDHRTKVILEMIVMDGHYTAEGVAMKFRETGTEITSRTVYRERDAGLLALAKGRFGDGIVQHNSSGNRRHRK